MFCLTLLDSSPIPKGNGLNLIFFCGANLSYEFLSSNVHSSKCSATGGSIHFLQAVVYTEDSVSVHIPVGKNKLYHNSAHGTCQALALSPLLFVKFLI